MMYSEYSEYYDIKNSIYLNQLDNQLVAYYLILIYISLVTFHKI